MSSTSIGVPWIEPGATPPLCDVPWLGRFVVLSTGETMFCCFSSVQVGDANKKTFAEMWQGDTMRRIRSELAAGQIPAECESSSCPVFRGDEEHAIISSSRGEMHARRDELALLRASLSGARLVASTSQAAVDEVVRFELENVAGSSVDYADLFVCVCHPGGDWSFLPDASSIPEPMHSGIAVREIAEPIELSSLEPGEFEVTAALVFPRSNPNLEANLLWADSVRVTVTPPVQ